MEKMCPNGSNRWNLCALLEPRGLLILNADFFLVWLSWRLDVVFTLFRCFKTHSDFPSLVENLAFILAPAAEARNMIIRL